MTSDITCTHESSSPESNYLSGGQNWVCSKCGVFTHRRCQAIDVDGEQCWMVEGHENLYNAHDRKHFVLRNGNIVC